MVLSIRKNKSSKYLITISIALSIMFMGLLALDAKVCRDKNEIRVSRDREQYLEMIIDNGNYQANIFGKAPEEGIIDFIGQEYNTSSSDFCFVAVDGEIIFLRDQNVTSKLDKVNYMTYFHLKPNAEALDATCPNTSRIVWNGDRWLLSKYDVENVNNTITVGICVNEAYVRMNGYFDTLMQHVLLYSFLFSVAFIACMFFLVHRETEKFKVEEKLTEQLIENRKLIERLGERIEEQADTDYRLERGFCPKKVMTGVLDKMTPGQKNKSYIITIELDNAEQYLIMRYSILLDNMRIGKFICCLWEDNKFVVLLLNSDVNDAQNFVKQLLLQYQKMFQSDIKNAKILINHLGDKHAI